MAASIMRSGAQLKDAMEGVFTLLQDTRVTVRKEAINRLGTILDSAQFLHELDTQTALLDPTAAVTGITWPGLAAKLAKYVFDQIQAAQQKQKAPDAALSKIMRRVVELAEDDGRSGREAQLVRRAGRLFEHVCDVLEMTRLGQTSPVGRDYVAILRMLLDQPEYGAAARPDDFHNLIDSHLDWLESIGGNLGHDETRRNISALTALVNNYPGDPGVEQLYKIMNVLVTLSESLHDVALLKVGSDFFSLAIAVLATHGPDTASSVSKFHGYLHAPALKALKSKDVRLRDRAVECVQMQLLLGAVTPTQNAELLRWAQNELQTVNWRAKSHATADIPISRFQRSLASLLASIYVYSSGCPLGPGLATPDNTTAEGPPNKRARSSPLLTTLGEQAVQAPTSVAAVSSIALLQFSLIISEAQKQEWVGLAAAELPAALKRWSESNDVKKSGSLLWLLRHVLALALACSQPPPIATTTSTPHSANAWRLVWDVLVESTHQLHPGGPDMEVALWCLATIADRKLCELPPTSYTVWSVPLLQLTPTPGGVALATAALRAQTDSVAHAGLWETEMLQWATREEAAGNPSTDILGAIGAFLRLHDPRKRRLKEISGEIDSSAPPGFGLPINEGSIVEPWVWWEPWEDVQAKVGGVIHGVAYMDARARMTDAKVLTRQREDLEASVAPFQPPAGVQMHADATTALASMIAKALFEDGLAGPDAPASMHFNLEKTVSQVLCTCATAISTRASVTRSQRAAGIETLPCWGPSSELAVQIDKVLSAVAPLIVSKLCTKDGLMETELYAFNSLALALTDDAKVNPLSRLGVGFGSIITQLESVFAINDQTAASAMVAAATQAPTQFTIAPSAGAFDDELDVAATQRRQVPSTQRSVPSVKSAASLAGVYKYRCAGMLHQLGSAFPVEVAQTAGKLLSSNRYPHPPSLHTRLVSVFVASAAAAMQLSCHEGPSLALGAISALDQVSGILSWKIERFGNSYFLPHGRLEFVLTQVRALAEALTGPHGLVMTAEATKAASELIFECMRRAPLPVSEESTCDSVASGVRIAQARAITVAMDFRDYFTGDALDEGIDMVVSLVINERYKARLAGARLLQKVLRRLSSPSYLWNQAVKQKLALKAAAPHNVEGDNADVNLEYLETAVITLGETAAACDELELDCLLSLAKEAALDRDAKPLVVATVDWLARTLGYPDRYAYASWYLPQLLHSWLLDPYMDVDQILEVRTLVGPDAQAADDPKAFLKAVAPPLVGSMILLQDEARLSRLAQLSYSSMESLVSRYADAVLAVVFPGTRSQNEEIRQLCTSAWGSGSLLNRILGSNVKELLGKNIVNGIARMLTMAQDVGGDLFQVVPSDEGRQPALPFFRPEYVVQAIPDLMPGFTAEEKKQMLWKNVLGEGQIAALLLHVQKSLARAHHPRHLSASKGALRAALLLLDHRVGRPATLRYVLHILMRQMKMSTMRMACCKLIEELIQGVVAHNNEEEEINTLGSLLPSVVASLVEAVEATAEAGAARRAGAAPAGSCASQPLELIDATMGHLVQLLEQITVRAPETLRPYLVLVDAIPEKLGMQGAAQAVWVHRQGTKASQQLLQFTARAASMPTTLRHRSLQALRDVLTSHTRGQLYEKELRAEANGTVLPAQILPQVAMAAWRLAVLSNELSDPHMAEFSGEVLALVGPLDPKVVAFNPIAALDAPLLTPLKNGGVPSTHSSKPALTTSTKGTGPSARAAHEILVAALRLLADYLVDEDANVVGEAQRTLRVIVNTEEGKHAQASLEPHTRSFVCVFRGGGVMKPKRHTETSSVEAAALWDLSSLQYEEWVCRLSEALLARADSALLYACRHMASLKPAFAELLMPLAFADLALHGSTKAVDGTRLASQMGATIARGILPFCTEKPKSMRLLLRCLDHVREMRLDALPPADGQGSFGAGLSSLTPEDALEWKKAYWVELDYLVLASAAVKCRAYFSALMYVESWCVEENGGRLGLLPPETCPRRREVDALLLDIYSNIQEPDALYAVARSNELLPQLRRFERTENWAQALVTSDLAMQSHSFQNTFPSSTLQSTYRGSQQHQEDLQTGKPSTLSFMKARRAIMCCLANLGASTLYGTVSRAWGTSLAMGEWEPLNLRASGGDSTDSLAAVDASLAAAVIALATGSAERCSQAVASARRALVASLTTAGLESAGDVNPALVRLQMLQEVGEAWDLKWPDMPNLGSLLGAAGETRRRRVSDGLQNLAERSISPEIVDPLLDLEESEAFRQSLLTWRGREASAGAGGRYDLLAPLQDLRKELIRILGVPEAEAECLAQTASAARKAGRFGIATASLLRLRWMASQPNAPPSAVMLDAPWRIEEAKVLWAQGQTDAALDASRTLLSSLLASHAQRGGGDSGQLPYVQAIVAKWLAATQAESSTRIQRMLIAAANLALEASEGLGSYHPIVCRILYRLARYADGLLRTIQETMNSAEWATGQSVIQRKEAELQALQDRHSDRLKQGKKRKEAGHRIDPSLSRIMAHMSLLKRHIQEDTSEREALMQRERQLRILALKSYGQCLQTGSQYDVPCAFRVIQLWLHHVSDPNVVEEVESTLSRAPSHKFLPLIYQVASRASANPTLTESRFQQVLQDLLVRVCCEHPFHSVLKVLALKNGNRGRDGKAVQADAVGTLAYVADEDKVAAANKVIQRAAATGPRCAEIIRALEEAVEGYIELAARPVSKDASKMPFPARFKRILTTLHAIPVLSVPIPVDVSQRYEDIPYAAQVSEYITFAGGVNKPKIVQIVDSHGCAVRQLVKGGNDDMRQDAVMQQFFGMVNAFLSFAEKTTSRFLRIRTYNVVPFSPAAGVVQWVDDTVPLYDVINQRRQIQPDEMRIDQAYNIFSKLAEDHVTEIRRLRSAFDTVTARLRPKLHRFFLEQYREAGKWFEARLAYTRSTAAASMAGHVIGLGDRHNSNILMDLSTAEVIHIDLGIAFEQGKYLPTPERVPFRLTANIRDGMGVTGVEGVMRRCCEETLHVLRAQKEALLTVLEVFVHDPLYKWGLTVVQAHRRQQPDDHSDAGDPDGGEVNSVEAGGGGQELVGNADAKRTLLRIKQKLEGMEGGDTAARSVEGQVAHLLTEAQDPDNLCRMYRGWMPFV